MQSKVRKKRSWGNKDDHVLCDDHYELGLSLPESVTQNSLNKV